MADPTGAPSVPKTLGSLSSWMPDIAVTEEAVKVAMRRGDRAGFQPAELQHVIVEGGPAWC